MMAGMAMISLLKMSGLHAIVMACAAFCIPISMTSVRRSLVVSLSSHASNAPQPVVAKMRTVIVRPKEANSFTIVCLC